MACPLCHSPDIHAVFEKDDARLGRREYVRCRECRLIHLLPQYFLSKDEEKKRYDLHRNSPDDQGYVDFLNQLIEPLCGYLVPGAEGMDYGCGPGPTVSVLLENKGFRMTNYDPVYFPDKNVLDKKYDFMTVTEVVEHFYNPRQEWLTFDRMLKPGSPIGLMTYLYTDVPQFSEGWYHSEPTHVCFYHRETFQWIENWLKWKIEYLTGRVVVFRKPFAPLV
ncbi:MAG: methyltransferase domain-containing protein [Candidatus Omnitrophota bacterium]